MASPCAELSDSFVSRTSDRSGVSTVSASESEVSDDGEAEEPVELVDSDLGSNTLKSI